MRSFKLAFGIALLLCSVAFAAPITYVATLSGAAEAPPNASPGTGTATVIIDVVAHTLDVSVAFADLVAPNTASHIHCCTAVPGAGTAEVATVTPTFTGFPTGTTSGSYLHTFDTTLPSSYRGGFITGHGGTALAAEAFLASGLAAGDAYLNIHSTAFPGGEIRGFLTPAPPVPSVPEPATLLLVGSALAGLAARRRSWRK